MSENPSAIEIKRTTEVMQVLAIIFARPQTTIQEACDEVGIHKNTYYHWIRKNPESLRVVKDFLADVQRDELVYLSAAMSEVNTLLARKALSDETDVAERLKIAKYLSGEAEKLQRTYQVTSGGEDAAEFLKDGPQVVTQKSKFASITVSQDDKGDVEVGLYRNDIIIDGIEVSDPLDEPDNT
jgi:transposase-like protein